MSKELSHRGVELKQLGWSEQDVFRYVELWDYRQRWGAINLEREDRLFLRKAESALPSIQTHKASVKKPINEKSYYCRINFFLEKMNGFEEESSVVSGDRGVWPILLEEELRTLNYFQPVLGLPDTLKAKAINSFREEYISYARSHYEDCLQNLEFSFNDLISSSSDSVNKSWPPLREKENDDQIYPVITSKEVSKLRTEIRSKIIPLIKNTLPSLSESDKPNPPEDWTPEINS